MISASSFSYRYGQPVKHATLVLDCRIIQNPHSFGGSDKAKRRRALATPEAAALMLLALAHLDTNPNGHVAFGCTYGKHRSYALAQALNTHMRRNRV